MILDYWFLLSMHWVCSSEQQSPSYLVSEISRLLLLFMRCSLEHCNVKGSILLLLNKHIVQVHVDVRVHACILIRVCVYKTEKNNDLMVLLTPMNFDFLQQYSWHYRVWFISANNTPSHHTAVYSVIWKSKYFGNFDAICKHILGCDSLVKKEMSDKKPEFENLMRPWGNLFVKTLSIHTYSNLMRLYL